MNNPNDPLDPMAFLNEAIANAHAKNEVIAANARIRQLEERLETLRDAGNAMYRIFLNAQTATPEELLQGMRDWQEARNNV
jgi:hypothetical protein